MTQIVNLTSFIGTAGQELSAADANWTQTYQGGSGIGTISDAARVYQSSSSEAVYVRSEAPGSANQTVAATIRQVAALSSGNHAGVVARKQSGVNTYITGVLRSESGGRQIRAYKVVGGTATQIGPSVSVTTANGTDYALQLEVTGQSPSLRIVVKLNGTTHIDQTINDTNLDAAGSVGIRFGFGTSASSSTTGLHIASFAASDDTGGSVVPISFAGSVSNQTGTEGVVFSLNLSTYFSGTETPFAYSVQAGTLPAGLSLNTSTGVISGTPTTAGVSSGIVIRATDATPDTADTNSFSITINAANTSPSFTGPSIDNISGTEGAALTSVDVSAKFFDSESGLTFSAIGSWPAGVTVSSTGVISGTPTTAGTYTSLQVRATDAGALTADSNAFSITVAAAAVTTITSDEFKNNTGTLLTAATIPKVWLIPFGTPDYTSLVTNGAGELVISEAGLSGDYLIVTANADGTEVGVSKATAS